MCMCQHCYFSDFNDRLGGESLDVTYTKPYTRIQSYLVGMFVGYLLYRTVDRKIKIPLVRTKLLFQLSSNLVYEAVCTQGVISIAQFKAVTQSHS